MDSQAMDAAFPATGNDAEKIDFILHRLRSLSVLSEQKPWHISTTDHTLELFTNLSEFSEFEFLDEREVLLDCGAALLSIRMALRHFGCLGDIEVFPDLDNPDHVASIRIGKKRAHSPNDQNLFTALAQRRANRALPAAKSLSETQLEQLEMAAALEKASLEPVLSEVRRRELLNNATLTPPANSLAARAVRSAPPDWTDDYTRQTENIRLPASRLGRITTPLYVLAVKFFERGQRFSVQSQPSPDDGTALGVLTSKTDDKRGWLAAGQGLARVLLQAKTAGLSVSFLNHALQASTARSRLKSALYCNGYPQAVLRLGHLEASTRTGPEQIEASLTQNGQSQPAH